MFIVEGLEGKGDDLWPLVSLVSRLIHHILSAFFFFFNLNQRGREGETESKERDQSKSMVVLSSPLSGFYCKLASPNEDNKPRNSPSTSILFHRRPPSSSLPSPTSVALCKTAPFAASLAILLCSTPAAQAGILSGYSGIESVPGPELPKIEFLSRFNEENQKRYAEFDERFKSSPLLRKLLEKSELNREKNKQEIQDKYCLRGAEWGVGDCSTEGMSPEDRDSFIAMLKQKVEGKPSP